MKRTPDMPPPKRTSDVSPNTPDMPPPPKRTPVVSPHTPNMPPPPKRTSDVSPHTPNMPPPPKRTPDMPPPPTQTHSPPKEQPKPKSPKEEMDKVVRHYLAVIQNALPKYKTPELEIRFQGIGGAPFTKMDYDAVIQNLVAAGFSTSSEEGAHIMRIYPQFENKKGMTQTSNVRVEIPGINLIQEYCNTNNIYRMINGNPSTVNKITFLQKSPVPIDETRPELGYYRAIDNADFRFRIGYQYEITHKSDSKIVSEMIKETNWANTKKTFRHLNRVQYTHPNLPIAADITILRNSSKYGKDMVPTYTVQDAKVFENDVSYEIELEILNNRVRGTQYAHSPSLLLNELRKMIRIILSAIQGTNYPIGEQEMRSVLKSYHKLVHGSNADNQKCSFIGPSSYTLQIENLVDTGNTVPNVLHNYTVTDKADGERKLLFVDGSGRLYLIDTSLRVQFTGTRTDHKKLTNSLFDGEHIKHDKYGKFINVFAIFDIYYVNNESVREYPFTRSDNHASLVEKGVPLPKYYRLALMNALPGKLNPVSVLDSRDNMAAPCPLRLKCKEFYSTESSSIFGICDKLFKQIEDGLFEYNTDGLIFTPSEYGVGGGPNMKSGPLFKHTWTRSFKWKPSEYNTIDFLVRVQKDENGKDRVKTIFSDGGIVQYKTLVLHCGFDPTKHEQSNPFQQLLDGNFEMKSSQSDESEAVQARVSTYRAKPFSPTNPADARACLCNIKLEKNAADNTFYMTTEEGGYFEENMIVEFKYDQSAEGAWRWKPLRVRHDKTKQTNGLCDGGFNYNRKPRESFGNDFTTANNNWYSIHNPITSQMLITGQGIPDMTANEGVYYSRKTKETNTRALRDFHNLYVKNKLIRGASHQADKLIDFAVGKAGDLSKWRSAGLDFVFGIDVSKDNIFNNKDGACARYLSDAAKFRNMPGAIFLHGNSALNIRSGEAFEGYKEQNIARALFGGEGNAKRNSEIGKMVGKYTGIVGEGFNVSSCQFALHYFFENVHTMHNFMRNVSECTRIGGTFIGTCWDGKLVFDTLRPKMCGESYTIKHPDTKEKVFEIIKLYENTAFPADELSLGYSISVYQESIGQHIVEYLVNFDFLCSIMEKYGFKLMNPSESTKFGFPKGTGTFRELYNQMITEYQQNPNAPYGEANMMTHYERTISFFNRYFIFKKMRNVNTEEFTNILRSVEPKEASKCVANATFESDVYIQQDREELESRKDKSATQTPAKKKEFIRKLDIQIIIKSYHPVQIDENGLKQGPGNKVIIRRKTASSGYPLLADTLGKEKMREYIDRIHTEIPITRYDAGYDRVFEVVSDEPGDYTRAVQEREILKTKLKLRKNGQVITLPSFVEVWNDPNSGLAKEILDSNNPHEAKWALQIKYGYKIATTFMPMYAKAIYDYFQGGSVLDPCAGWGDRMLGALLSNNVREYVGFDPNRNLLAGYAKIQEDVGYKVISQTGNETVYANETGTGVRSTIYSMPFEESEKVLKMRKFDFAFTSPPFFDYEDYSDKNPKYTNWYTQFYEPLFKIVERHLNAGSIFAIHIGDTSGGKIMEFLHETVPKITNFVMVDKIGLVGGKSGKIRDVHVFRLMDGRR